MAEKDAFDERRKGLEEEYFYRHEKELMERLRARADISAATGIVDEEVLKNLQELGFTRETVPLLHIVPLAQIAWSDGEMSQHERDLILEVAASRGVEEGSEAHSKLVGWLRKRPSEEFFAAALKVAGIMAKTGGDESTPADLVDYCTRVAEASGGVLGFGRISKAERDLIARIAGEFERDHADAAHKVVDEA
jgi:hypothetical protein